MNQEQSQMLREVHEAVVGNRNTGNDGLLARTAILERRVLYLFFAAIASGGALGLERFLALF